MTDRLLTDYATGRGTCQWPLASGRRQRPTSLRRSLFDDLIGACDQRQGYRDTKRLGGFEIDRHFERRWLNDRELGRLLTFEDPSNVNAGLVPCITPAGAVADQASSRCEFRQSVDRRNPIADRQCRKLLGLRIEKYVVADDQRTGLEFGRFGKDRVEIAFGAGIQDMEIETELDRRLLDIFRLGLGIGIGRI